MGNTRKIKAIFKAQKVTEGAGVRLKRIFSNNELKLTDPFLLLDDFHSDRKEDYIKGFPWHPHRGIETITYVLHGDVEHGDSIGNSGVISDGDVQWMTAGSGIIHQEMPKGDKNGLMWGFQLWANLPKSEKMCAPRYRDVKSTDIPELTLEGGIKIKIICGEVDGIKGPVSDIAIKPEYLDVTIPPEKTFRRSFDSSFTVMAYIIQGSVNVISGEAEKSGEPAREEQLILFESGSQIHLEAGTKGTRLILVSGKPLNESVAWYGPIVMNTDEEINTARRELSEGTFLKNR